MIKSLLEQWKAAHALTLHSEAHKPYPCDTVWELRDSIVEKKADNAKAQKLTSLAEYWATCEAY